MGDIHKEALKIYVENDEILRRNQGDEAVFNLGVVGEDAFGDRAYTIDDRTHTIKFHPRNFSLAKNRDAVPFFLEGSEIVVTPKINDREVQMFLDTGCSSTAFSDSSLSAIGMSRPTDAAAAYAIGSGGRRASYVFEIKSIKLGGIEKNNVQASCDLHSTAGRPLLGRSFLSGLVLTIDPVSKLILLSR
ncbi:MAG: retroviral-like aspartic protease family protein [Candidatus Obscuribacterales bacterium]|nr:retroviral-like aspartic protease family protein [Candidatus Obscuribacterales bacterium]